MPGNLIRRFEQPLAAALALLLLLQAPLPAQVGGDADEEFQRKATRLETIVFRRPRKGTAFDLWMQHYRDAGREDELVASVSDRRSAATGDAATQLIWGLVCQRLQRHEEAIEAFGKARDLAEDDYYPRLLMADELLRRQRVDQAITELSQALELTAPRADFLQMARQLATAYQLAGQEQQARQVWNQIATKFHRDVRVLSELATLVENEGHYDDALRFWKMVHSGASDDPFQRFNAQLRMAQIHLRAGQNPTALNLLEPLLSEVDPDSWRADHLRQIIEQALVSQSGIKGLVSFWSKRSADHPNDLTALVQWADALARDNQSQAAEQLYRRALERAPKHRQLHDGLISLLVTRGDFAAAVAQTERLAEAFPRDIDVWWQLGQLQLRNANGDRSSSQQKALQAWKNIADLQAEDAEAAVRVAEACRAAVQPTSSSQNDRPSQLAADVRQRETMLIRAAEEFYREAIRREPDAAQYKEYLGEFLHWLDRSDDAVAAFQAMAKSDTASAWYDVSRVLARYDYFPAAVDAARQAVDKESTTVEYRAQYVELLSRAGRHDEAFRALDTWPADSGDSRWQATAIQLRIDLAVAADRLGREIAVLQRRLESQADQFQAHWTMALLLAAAGQSEAAAAAMERAVQLRPDDARLRRPLARLLETANRPDQAVAQYHWLVTAEPERRRDDYQRIIDLELRQNHLDQALDVVGQLVRVAPSDPESHLLKATVAMRRGDLKARVAALRRAVQVAPRDLQMRRQLASALRDSRQLREALEEAYQCFDLAESLSEKRSVLSWTLDWVPGMTERKWLLRKVRQNQQEQSESLVMTMSLVHLLQRMGRHDEALSELRRLQLQHPNNTEILANLVQLAELTNQTDAAIEYQEQLVRLTDSGMEPLARLYRQAGRLEDAAGIWDELLNKNDSLQQAILTVDRLLRQEDLFQAQRFVEAGLARFPESWRLAYRAGLIHLAGSQPVTARRAFVSVLEAREAAHASQSNKATAAAMDYQQLALALTARQLFRTIGQRIERHGARNPTTLRRLFDSKILRAGGSNSLSATKTFSAVALLTLAYAEDESVPWLDRIDGTNENAAKSRRALISAWVTYRAADCRRLMLHLRDQDSSDPLPHLLRILNPPAWDSNDGYGPVAELHDSYEWLVRNQPVMAQNCRSLYVARLFHHRDKPTVAQLTRELLEQAEEFGDLPPLIPLVRLANDGEMTRRYFARVNRAFPRNTQVPHDELHTVLQFAVDSLDWMDDEQLRMVEDLFDACLNTSTPSLLSGRSTTAGTQLFSRLVKQLNDDVSELLRQRRLERGRQSPSRPHGSPTEHLKWLSHQRDVLQSQMTGTFVINGRVYESGFPLVTGSKDPGKNTWFPVATTTLDDWQVETISQITSRMAEHGQGDRWLEHLRQAGTSQRAAGFRFQLAVAFAAWHAGLEQRAIHQLQELASADRSDVTLALLVVRAFLQQGQLANALAELNRITVRNDAWHLLRRAVASQWSERALLRTLQGHSGTVTSVAFSPDGASLASTSVDRTIGVWDVARGELRDSLSAHGDIVLAAAFSPKEDLLATAGYDQKTRLWHWGDLSPAGTLGGHGSAVRAVAFSPDGQRLATAGDDRVIVIWRVADGQPDARLNGHHASITSLHFAPSGAELASSDAHGAIRIWDLASRSTSNELELSCGAARSITYLDADRLAAGYEGDAFAVWTRDKGSWKAQKFDTQAAVRSIAFDPNANQLALGLDDHSVQLRDAVSGAEQMILKAHSARVLSAAYSPNGQRLATAGFDGEIKLWQTPGAASRGAR